MSHARTIHTSEMTNLMISSEGNVLISFRLNATHPYERLGKHVRDEIYDRLPYRVGYGKTPAQDRISVFHTI